MNWNRKPARLESNENLIVCRTSREFFEAFEREKRGEFQVFAVNVDPEKGVLYSLETIKSQSQVSP